MPDFKSNFTGAQLQSSVQSGSTVLGFARPSSNAPWYIDQNQGSMSFFSGSSNTDYRKVGSLGLIAVTGAPLPPLVLFGSSGNVGIRTNKDSGAALEVNGIISASGYHESYTDPFERDSNGDLMPRNLDKVNNEHWQITGSSNEELCLRDTMFTYPLGTISDGDLLDSLLFG